MVSKSKFNFDPKSLKLIQVIIIFLIIAILIVIGITILIRKQQEKCKVDGTTWSKKLQSCVPTECIDKLENIDPISESVYHVNPDMNTIKILNRAILNARPENYVADYPTVII